MFTYSYLPGGAGFGFSKVSAAVLDPVLAHFKSQPLEGFDVARLNALTATKQVPFGEESRAYYPISDRATLNDVLFLFRQGIEHSVYENPNVPFEAMAQLSGQSGVSTVLKSLARNTARFGANAEAWTQILEARQISTWQPEDISEDAKRDVRLLTERIAAHAIAGAYEIRGEWYQFGRLISREFYRTAPAYAALRGAGITYDDFRDYVDHRTDADLCDINGNGLLEIDDNVFGGRPVTSSLPEKWPNIVSEAQAWLASRERPETKLDKEEEVRISSAAIARLENALIERMRLHVAEGSFADSFDPDGDQFLAAVNGAYFPKATP